MRSFKRDLQTISYDRSVEAPLLEFVRILNYGTGLPEWSHKNEKDWPPIHSREQSLEIISMRGD